MPTESAEQELLIVTGMSGAGRTTVGNALEDMGWYVVDNLPPQMLRPLADLASHVGNKLPKLAAVVDIRGGEFFEELQDIIHAMRGGGIKIRVLFLEATDDVLVRRFESVRRPHPLQEDGTLLDGIAAERGRLGELRGASDFVIDTTSLNIHQLATTITEKFAEVGAAGINVTVQSFGFKYGVPTDVDMVADARFLPNPFWIPELRSFTGQDPQVAEYVLSQPGAREFLSAYLTMLEPVLAGYQRENKRHVTIAIGCTGGKHRSVAMSIEIGKALAAMSGVAVSVKHRDLGRE